jgi:thioredoxin 1
LTSGQPGTAPAACSPPLTEPRQNGTRNITFAKVDTEAEQALAAAANITSIPTLMAFKGKTLVFSQPGAFNAIGLEQVIQAVRNLDLDKRGADVAQQPA